MKLYLIRHGQTQWNREGRIQGRSDIPLNETGQRQARCLAGMMERYTVAAVFSSPLMRALQTAEAVAGSRRLPVISAAELIELDFGLWEGLTLAELEERFGDDYRRWKERPASFTPTGGETRGEIKERCRLAIRRILRETQGDAAVVTHGGVMVHLLGELLGEREKREIIVGNASITTVEYDRDTQIGTLLRLNERGYLGSGGKQARQG